MATERQIAANRRNAALSTGPITEEGKARSRANATKHGLAGESAEVEAADSPAFRARRASWAAEHPPVGEAAGWALDRAVAASLQIERCEHALDKVLAASRERACLSWDQDRAVEAATIFGRLARDPGLTSRRLQTSLAGVELLVEAWTGLVVALEAGADWSESEASKALDLLGVAVDLRSGRTLIDGPEGQDAVGYHRALALEEIERLEALRDEAMVPLDDMERRLAMSGALALLSKPARLVLRYERDAWRRYRESIRQARDQDTTPAPTVASRPAVQDRAVDPSPPPSQEEARASRSVASPRPTVVDRTGSMGRGDGEPSRLDPGAMPIPATERSQLAGAGWADPVSSMVRVR